MTNSKSFENLTPCRRCHHSLVCRTSCKYPEIRYPCCLLVENLLAGAA